LLAGVIHQGSNEVGFRVVEVHADGVVSDQCGVGVHVGSVKKKNSGPCNKPGGKALAARWEEENGEVRRGSCCSTAKALALAALEVLVERLGASDTWIVDSAYADLAKRPDGDIRLACNFFNVGPLQFRHDVIEHLTHG
jgi:hypothetical protein